MDRASLAVKEYDCQLYGFTTSAVVTGIKNFMDDIMNGVLEELSRKLSNKLKQEEIQAAKKTFFKCYHKAFDTHVAELRETINEIFSIKENILLPIDEIQKEQYTEEEEKKIIEEIEEAKCKLRAIIIAEKRLEMILKSIINEDVLINEIHKYLDNLTKHESNFKELEESVASQLCKIEHLADQFANLLTTPKINDSDNENMDI